MNNKYTDLVDKLRKCAMVLEWATIPVKEDYLIAMRDAADVIESLSVELEKKENGGWIKCSERMPDTVKVWGCVRFSDVVGNTLYQEEVVFYDGDGTFTNYGNIPVPVVAWHPLPEPYKESAEVEE